MEKYVGCSCTGSFYISIDYDVFNEPCNMCGSYDDLVCEYEDSDYDSILEAIEEVYERKEYRVMPVLQIICEEEKLDVKTTIEECKKYIIDHVNSTFNESNLE